MDDDTLDLATFDYTTENKRCTHILIVDFPEPCDEATFLLTLKNYLRAQSENLSRIYDNKKNH